MPSAPPAGRARLFCAAFLALFVELALIRFVPAHVKVVGYYTNLILIASFFGLGLGFLAAGWRKRLLPLFLPLLCLVLMLVRVSTHLQIGGLDNIDEPFWTDAGDAGVEVPMTWVVLGFYAAVTLAFVPIGQVMGRLFGRFPRLVAYSLDLGGSLAGVLAFGLCSVLGTPPTVWLGCAGLLLVVVLAKAPWERGLGALATVGAVVLAATLAQQGEFWSPYYRVDVVERMGRQVILTNGTLHQIMLDFDSPEDRYTHVTEERFQIPYKLAKELGSGTLGDVLVVGAGSGNDVVVATRMGAEHIDAVEIDPTFPRLGRELHLQSPYDSERVTLHIADARTYFKRCERRYDLIVFGTLDSQALVSGLSTVRLDNYVYTRDSFKEAYALLAPGGVLAVFHQSQSEYIADRIYLMLAEAGGRPPWVRKFERPTLFNMLFLQGSRVPASPPDEAFRERLSRATIPSDDWPFFYLRSPRLPWHYAQVLIGVLVLGLLGTGVALRGRIRAFDGPLFLLGAGFLLLETKAVTQMSLLFGSTWKVHLLVFSSILAMLLGANLYVLRRERLGRPLDLRVLVAALAGLLVLLTQVDVNWIASFHVAIQWLLASAIVGAPLLLAGLLFPTLFARAADARAAFASNLLGAIVGGLAEYASLAYGMRSLAYVAAAFYVTAYVLARRTRP